MKSCYITWLAAAGLVAALAGGFLGTAAARDWTNDLGGWMHYASDATCLAGLTIPGTHNSGALHEPFPGTAQCQNLSIRQQLDIGVRYLDIRLRQSGNALQVHHGMVNQRENFDGVLTQVVAFLKASPGECVIMEVSSEYTPENNTEPYEQTFLRYATNAAYAGFWWRQTHMPRLGEVRGKIVLLRRFADSAGVVGGIDGSHWRDNAVFTFTDPRGTDIVVQDEYEVTPRSNDHKWRAITNQLTLAALNTNGAWRLNYTSGFRSVLGVPNITGVATDLNDRLRHYFDTETTSGGHYGTVISDFINPEITRRELRTNFNPPGK